MLNQRQHASGELMCPLLKHAEFLQFHIDLLEQRLTSDRTFLGKECCRDERGRVDSQYLSQLRYLVNGRALQPTFQRAQICPATNV